MEKRATIGIVILLGVFLALPALDALATNGTTTTSTVPFKAVVNGLCMQTAVEKRDTAIIGNVTVYHASTTAALATRRDALKAAWGLPDRTQMRQAAKTAWSNYRQSLKNQRRTLRDSKRAVWKQFNTDRKVCKPSPTSDGVTGWGVDEPL